MESSGKPIAQLARDLGVNDNNLYRWRSRQDVRSPGGIGERVLRLAGAPAQPTLKPPICPEGVSS